MVIFGSLENCCGVGFAAGGVLHPATADVGAVDGVVDAGSGVAPTPTWSALPPPLDDPPQADKARVRAAMPSA
jgi:hypothetical protein